MTDDALIPESVKAGLGRLFKAAMVEATEHVDYFLTREDMDALHAMFAIVTAFTELKLTTGEDVGSNDANIKKLMERFCDCAGVMLLGPIDLSHD